MHTAKQMIPAVGSQVMVRFEGFGVPMLVTDAKSSYGRVRLQVAPMGGQGEAWIDIDRVLHVIWSSRVQTALSAQASKMRMEVK